MDTDGYTFHLYPKAKDIDGNEPEGTTYIFNSSKDAVATVNSEGVVTLVSTGSVSISVTVQSPYYLKSTIHVEMEVVE